MAVIPRCSPTHQKQPLPKYTVGTSVLLLLLLAAGISSAATGEMGLVISVAARSVVATHGGQGDASCPDAHTRCTVALHAVAQT
jgi:hypothetical protein